MNPKPLNLNCSPGRFLWISIALILLVAAALYWLQNSGTLSGGAIAPVKLAWLITVVVYWYLLPVYWLLDSTVSCRVKLVCGVFFISMLLRAIVELSMMYITSNWLHSYGIGHNVFSAVLCIYFAFIVFGTSQLVGVYFLFCTVLFSLETFFAGYLRSVSNKDGTVFFIESAPEHLAVLRITGIAVIVSIAVFSYIIRSKQRAAA